MRFTLQPATGDNFIDREKLLVDMIQDLKDKKSTIGYALYGKRRVGKTSIMKEVERRLKKHKNLVVVYFSVWDLIEYSLSEFCQKLSTEIIEAYRPFLRLKHRTRELLQTPLALLRDILDKTELKIIYREIEFLLSIDTHKDPETLIKHAFSLPERLAEETNTKCILMIDEFPSLTELKINGSRVGEPIIRKIRTIFEDWKMTTLCISGSIRSTVKLVFLSATSPFYRQLVIKEIEPLEKNHVRKLLVKNLKNISEEAVDEIYDFSVGIPFYVQFLGKMLEKKNKITIDDVKLSEREFLKEEGNIIFKEEFNSLSSNERSIILTMSRGNHTPVDISNSVGNNISNINRFLTYLEEKGHITRIKRGFYVINDPVFEWWLKQR